MNSNLPPFVDFSQLQAAFNTLNGSAGVAGDGAAAIFNVASTLAMSSLFSMPQTGTNPAIANAAKMLLGMNMLHQQSDLLNSQAAAASNIFQNPLFLQQYVSSIARLQQPPTDLLSSPAATLRPNPDNQRKRSICTTETTTAESPKRAPRHDDHGPTVPMTKDEFEGVLDRILNEEIYNIYEDELKNDDAEDDIQQLTPTTNDGVSEEASEVQSSQPQSSELTTNMDKLSLFELIDMLTSEQNSFRSAGSAFRKIQTKSSDSSGNDCESVWNSSLSPGNSSPVALSPMSTDTLSLISEAVRHLKNMQGSPIENISAVWRGQLLMKSHEAFVQLHLLAGGSSYLAGVIGSVMESMKTTKTIRISQRMKADTNQVKALLARLLRGEGAACLAVPVGHTLQECQYHNDNLKNQFVEYFSAKAAAGISMFTDDSDQKVTRDLAYVFPPGEFVESFIKEISFELYARIKSKQAPSFNYLFVIVVPADELHNNVATTAAANTST